jgi:hypothetical protein
VPVPMASTDDSSEDKTAPRWASGTPYHHDLAKALHVTDNSTALFVRLSTTVLPATGDIAVV